MATENMVLIAYILNRVVAASMMTDLVKVCKFITYFNYFIDKLIKQMLKNYSYGLIFFLYKN